MPYQTDERLKSYLDTNQLYREQMCLALLKNDRRFTNVVPRQPHGGADGGRDIEALYMDREKTFGAVGFINQANDSKEQKKQIKKKFKDDLARVVQVEKILSVFIFFTNIRFTVNEKDSLIMQAKKVGISTCEIWDRERLRIGLDTADGFCIRYQYLGISLSEEEQASFFSRWGDDIQSVISTGFQKIEKKLDDIIFYQVANETLQYLSVTIKLKRVYKAEEIGHFRMFCFFDITQPHCKIDEIIIGASDKSHRMMPNLHKSKNVQLSGIKYGICRGAWEGYYGNTKKLKSVSPSASIGMNEVEKINFSYNKDGFIIRYPHNMSIMDINKSYFVFFVNKSISKCIDSIIINANEYTIEKIYGDSFLIDESDVDFESFPVLFSEEEMKDPWVRIRPNNVNSLFKIDFHKKVPQRISIPEKNYQLSMIASNSLLSDKLHS